MNLKILIISLIFGAYSVVYSKNIDEQSFNAINSKRHFLLDGLATFSEFSLAFAPLTWSYMLYEGISEEDNLKKEKALWSAGGVASLVLVNQVLKISIQRERPIFGVSGAKGDYEHSFVTRFLPSEKYSFVSQASSLAFFSAKYFSDEYGYKPIFYTWAGLIAWSKIYKGAHYPGDVLAGGLLGYGTAWATQLLHQNYRSTAKNVLLLPLANGLLIQARF